MTTIDVQKLISGDIRTISRAISRVENDPGHSDHLLTSIYPHVGSAYRLGVTGPPGSGKSTLVDQLILHFRSAKLTVGVISIDPTSPFTGGAVLGDRIRMAGHWDDRGVYIRSMASRGSLGGLAVNTQEAGDILDAAGMDVIVYETVGVGQAELDIAQAADTTLVVLVPESGDEVQALKSGLMEIADLFVLNKSDREGANKAYTELSSILELGTESTGWEPRIIRTSALQSEGITELYTAIESHKAFLAEHGDLRRKRQSRYKNRVEGVVRQRLTEMFWTSERSDRLHEALAGIDSMTQSPNALARELIADLSL